MKSKIINLFYSFLILVVSIYIIVNFKYTTTIFKDTLTFLMKVIVPSLFPFMVFLNFILFSNCIDYLAIIIKPLGKLFNISGYGIVCLISSILGGFPYSAIIVSTFYKENKIDFIEAKRLSLILFLPSLSFLLSMYNIDNNFIYIIISLYMSTLLLLFISKYLFKNSTNENKKILINNDFTSTYLKVMNSSIQSILTISFSIIFFRLISSIFSFIFKEEIFTLFIQGIFEFSYSSINILMFENYGILKYLLLVLIISFSSFSIILQSYFYLKDINIKIKQLIAFRLITALLTLLLFIVIF